MSPVMCLLFDFEVLQKDTEVYLFCNRLNQTYFPLHSSNELALLKKKVRLYMLFQINEFEQLRFRDRVVTPNVFIKNTPDKKNGLNL